MNREKTLRLSYFCRQTGKYFCRQTSTTRHILQRQKIPLKGCSQKAFIKASRNAGFPDGSEGSAAPKPAVHGERLRTPAPVQVLFPRVGKQAQPTQEHPSSRSGSVQDGWSLPQRCPDLCQAAGFQLALSSPAPVSTPDLFFIACCSSRVYPVSHLLHVM